MGGITNTYDSGSVAAGAAIDSGAVDFGSADEVTVTFDNSAGAVTRLPTVNFLRDDGTVEFSPVLTTVAIGAKAAFVVSTSATARGTEGANGSVGAIPMTPSRRLQFLLAAGGAAAGRITARGRS